MHIFLLILGFFAYIFLYTFASFLFNYKIFLVNNDKYYLGAIVSGSGLFINFSLYAFIPFITLHLGSWIVALILVIALMIGSFLSNAIMGRVDLFHQKKTTKKIKENEGKK